jgi:SH3-like domain-containing protein
MGCGNGGNLASRAAKNLIRSRSEMRVPLPLIVTVAIVSLAATPAAAQKKKVDYWASISAGEARMRTGPGRQFPSSWLYKRTGLPVRVIETYPNWRKIEDPDGTQGWIQASLLSGDRTGLVTGDVRPLREAPSKEARIIWKAEPGVVGRLSDCSRGWCKLDVRGRMGYIETAHMFGADKKESAP